MTPDGRQRLRIGYSIPSGKLLYIFVVMLENVNSPANGYQAFVEIMAQPPAPPRDLSAFEFKFPRRHYPMTFPLR
jgi:hypothetical protein